MTQTKNIIKKLVVEVDTNSMEQALLLKNDLKALLETHVYPKLDQLFDSESTKEQYIHFNQLNIDIALIDGSNWSLHGDTIANKIKSEIQEKKQINTTTKGPTTETIISKNKATISPTKETTIGKNKATKTIETFLYFLAKGQLPWWNRISKNELEKQFINTLNKDHYHLFYNFIFNESNNLYRLINQFDNQFITKIYLKFLDKSKNDFTTSFKVPRALENKSIRKSYWKFAFLALKDAKTNSEKSVENFENLIINIRTKQHENNTILSLSAKEIKTVFELLYFSNNTLDIPVSIAPAFMLPHNYQIIASKQSIGITSFHTISDSKPFHLKLKSQNHLLQKTLTDEIRDLQAEDTMNTSVFENQLSKEVQNEGIIVQQAGLVLLHPFLKTFFEKLKFLVNGKLIPSKKEAAAHILHYLATGNEQACEYEMSFEKLLCDIPLSQPIDRFIKITPFQKEQCEVVLKAMLGHWKSIKTENIQVVQNEFFQREGKLSFQNDKVLLTIPRKTQDILLESLPWNIHLIKIPWKEKLIFTNW